MAYRASPAQELHLGGQGRTVIPVEFWRALDFRASDDLVAWMEQDRLVIRSRRSIAKELRGIFKNVAAGRNLADELIAERRAGLPAVRGFPAPRLLTPMRLAPV